MAGEGEEPASMERCLFYIKQSGSKDEVKKWVGGATPGGQEERDADKSRADGRRDATRAPGTRGKT